MSSPSGSPPVPGVVSRIAAGRPVRAVWLNELGALTFRIECGGDGTEYVKTGPGEFAAEADRLAWASRYTPVPRVLGYGSDWLHTAGLPGESAVHPHWVARPQQAARAIGAGLRMLHDRLPVASCPWVRTDFEDAPPVDRLVVCHGDACAPNTLIDADGRFCGHVDLGALGVADRWADLAVATLSLGWNYPGLREEDLLEAYGIEPDAIRIDYYRRSWQTPDHLGG
ncbi:aminoglycoside 3'-phosphotransferase [Mycolicibacterium komossense]|uniref:Aminoglycoside 3'-phosphotransferase n=1 Tax=Mycolicibacterium komossense TaxID=1779 RepID=A0ABT3C9L8_9MYCO|nr:aminoglycoside 3'-phosphotransferase [Mycolicibacterium komossense]MCV7226155.1 aminoglycoside 3'-phosphotransferase [Mycolicibacterium komossense]